MEGLKKRIIVLSVIIGLVGIGTTVIPRGSGRKIDERWMETKAPTSVGEFAFQASEENPGQSYRMDQRSYDLLKPFGIVCRVYSHGDKSYDVVLIASDKRESFHDPTVCFPGQGWTVKSIRVVDIDTKKHGKIPVTLSTMHSSTANVDNLVVYFYRTPTKFVPLTGDVTLAMFSGPLRGHFNTESVFYRFMPRSPDIGEKDLLGFVDDYLSAADLSSGGFF